MKDKLKQFHREVTETFAVRKVYEARWVWYHTILAAELFIVIILLAGILVKI